MHGRRAIITKYLKSGRDAFKRLTLLGLPPDFPIVQFPNAPLILALVAGVIGKHVHGSAHDYAAAISYLALSVWAYEELVQGVNWFRRLLGFAFMILIVVRVANGFGA